MKVKATIYADEPGDVDPVWCVRLDIGGETFELPGSWETVGGAVDGALKWAGDRAYTLRWPLELEFVALEDLRRPA